MLQATTTNVGKEIVICLLLLTTANVHPKQIIYIDKVNGTLGSKCWVDKAESGTVEVTLDGVELHNSTLVVVMHECKCEKLQESVPDAPQHQQYPTWFFPDPSLNGIYRCGDRSSNANNEN